MMLDLIINSIIYSTFLLFDVYLVYVDESGTAAFEDHNKYILTGVLIHESTWRKFDRKINKLKQDLFITSETEFHTNLIAQGIDEFSNYPEQKRHSILKRMANIIKKNRCRLISVIIEQDKIIPENRTRGWVYLWAWRQLLERVEKYLARRNSSQQTNYGLICMDHHSDRVNNLIKQIIQEFRSSGSMVINSRFIIEDPFFVNSELRSLTQLVDFVCWVVKQWYHRHTGNTSPYDQFNMDLFHRIEDRFDTDSSGGYHGAGIKIFP